MSMIKKYHTCFFILALALLLLCRMYMRGMGKVFSFCCLLKHTYLPIKLKLKYNTNETLSGKTL